MGDPTEVPPKDPLDFPLQTAGYTPAISAEVLRDLQAKIKTIPPEQAETILRAAAEAVKERQSATEMLSLIVGSIGKVLGLVL